MIVRDGAAADADAIASFWNPLIRETVITFSTTEYTPTDIAGMIAERPRFLVAEIDGNVGGFATYKQFRAGNGYAHSFEHSIIVDPRLHRVGIASVLMDALESAAIEDGVHVLVGGVTGSNTAAVKFHEARGYTLAGVLPQTGWKFGQWLDLHLMQKTFQS